MSRILTEALIRLELFDKQLLHYNFQSPTHSLTDNTVLQKFYKRVMMAVGQVVLK